MRAVIERFFRRLIGAFLCAVTPRETARPGKPRAGGTRIVRSIAAALLASGVTLLLVGCQGGGEPCSPVSIDPDLVLTELAPCFEFSDDCARTYLLLYAGEGKDLTALRTAFEGERLSHMTAGQLASFEMCDLGGSALILLVPRYEGLSVWINEIEHQGDMMMQGAEVARFESGRPVYIYCDFSDKLPAHEIHVSFDNPGEFFTTRESLLESIKP